MRKQTQKASGVVVSQVSLCSGFLYLETFVVLLQIGKLKNPQRDENNGLLASQSINH
jgi:hypothetical protein